MKCPLYFIGRTAVIPREGADIGDCLKEKCAWWSKDDGECIVQSIDYRLGDIAHWLGSLATIIKERGRR